MIGFSALFGCPPFGFNFATDYHQDNTELLDNDGTFILDNDATQILDNV